MQRVWLEAMPWFCRADYFACGGVPLGRRTPMCVCAEWGEIGRARFETEIEADRWCTAWNLTFRICDLDGQCWGHWSPNDEESETDEEEVREYLLLTIVGRMFPQVPRSSIDWMDHLQPDPLARFLRPGTLDDL